MVDKATLHLENVLEDIFSLLEDGEFKQAKYVLKKAAKKYPRHYLTSYAEGLYAGFKGDHIAAIKYLLKSIETHSEYALAHYNLAISYQKIHRADLCIKHHVAALKYATPEEREIITESQRIIKAVEKELPAGFTIERYLEDSQRFDSAFELLQAQDYEAALSLFEVVASNQPKHVQARGNLGICYLMLQDYVQSRSYFEKALALDPDYEPAQKNLAILDDIEAGLLNKPMGMESTYFYAEKAAKTNKK